MEAIKEKNMRYIQAFCKKNDYSDEIMSKAIELTEKVMTTRTFQGRKPSSIYASALYIASRIYKMRSHKHTQVFIGDEMCVTEVTLRKRYKELLHFFGLNLED